MLRAIVMLSFVGGLAHASPAPVVLDAEGERITHLYHNAATGETIVSRPTRSFGSARTLAWGTDGQGICGDQHALGAVMLADNPADPERFGLIHMDWGDIALDTVVSMVQFGVATGYPDIDRDGDGIADGVPGLGVQLTFYRGENGAGGSGVSEEAGSVMLMDIPGNLSGFSVEGYVFSVDLAGIGSAGGVPLGPVDVDGDGLADFGYSIEYLHPDYGLWWETYLFLGAPSGQAVPDGQGGWAIIPDPAPNAQGTTDAINVYRRDNFGKPEFVETIGGAFSCEPGATGAYAQIAISLFEDGTAPGCAADLFPHGVPDGQLNFFDLSAYLGLFNAQDPAADFFPVGGDGQFNFFDVSAYIAAFNAGCP